MGANAAKGQIDSVLREIPLVPPWTVDEFAAWMEDRFGRDIVLSPWQTAAPNVGEPGACGLTLVTADAFVVKYGELNSERHQRQQIFHEFGHILCEHGGERFATSMPVSTSVIAAGIDPKMIQTVLHRGVFETDEERMAELLGTRLAVMSRRVRGGDGRFDRIASAFFEPTKQ
ncbi:hypothetical protein GTV32_22990 [Gordonia sp. SID5947]|uniref:hypothetical protein n=1 Tax=Gordonia sp. SID5947 TaxID=2690315 RepID=UPI00136966E1|nr:hypothetical protein [Gordonia sp. SID5947]MYR09000.1 hypothetical protein [Gordonia sp. SID5947]